MQNIIRLSQKKARCSLCTFYSRDLESSTICQPCLFTYSYFMTSPFKLLTLLAYEYYTYAMRIIRPARAYERQHTIISFCIHEFVHIPTYVVGTYYVLRRYIIGTHWYGVSRSCRSVPTYYDEYSLVSTSAKILW